MTLPADTSAAAPETKLGTCTWCEAEDVAIYLDNGRCDECDYNVKWCVICKEEYHRDKTCRHIFQGHDSEWDGAGVDYAKGYHSPSVRRSFAVLLNEMPPDFAINLREAIESGRFHTWLLAPLIGGGGILELHGMPDRDGQSMLTIWGDLLMKIGAGERAEETADGYRWLASLYDERTPAANERTIRWIDEWLTA